MWSYNFSLVWVSFQRVEWAQISKNDMLEKKGLHFQFIVSDQSGMLWILEEKCKRIFRTRPSPTEFRHMCRFMQSPHLPNWKKSLVRSFFACICLLFLAGSFVKKLMACLCLHYTHMCNVGNFGLNESPMIRGKDPNRGYKYGLMLIFYILRVDSWKWHVLICLIGQDELYICPHFCPAWHF